MLKKEQHKQHTAIHHCYYCSSTHTSVETLLTAAICVKSMWLQTSTLRSGLKKASMSEKTSSVVMYCTQKTLQSQKQCYGNWALESWNLRPTPVWSLFFLLVFLFPLSDHLSSMLWSSAMPPILVGQVHSWVWPWGAGSPVLSHLPTRTVRQRLVWNTQTQSESGLI